MYQLFKPHPFWAVLLLLFIVSCVPGAVEPGPPAEPAYPAPTIVPKKSPAVRATRRLLQPCQS